jgi:hypothetical protein
VIREVRRASILWRKLEVLVLAVPLALISL